MGKWFAKSWFLILLLVLLPSGMACGWSMSASLRAETFGRVHPAVTTTIILFLMSFSLDSDKLLESFRAPRPVIWGMLVNIGLMPLMAWPLAITHGSRDFAVGLMITAAVPCTLATASVSTRQAGGNDAVSLLITLFTNLVGVVLTPLWLKWTLSAEAVIDTWPIIRNLTFTVLLPTIGGQLIRWIPAGGRLARAQKFWISIAAQCLVLLIVTKAAVEAGAMLRSQNEWPVMGSFARLLLECLALHTMAMIVSEYGGRVLRISRINRIATVFAGSQKTLPVGLLLSAMPAVTGDRSLPFVTFPILMFHALQLVLDTAVAERIALAEIADTGRPVDRVPTMSESALIVDGNAGQK